MYDRNADTFAVDTDNAVIEGFANKSKSGCDINISSKYIGDVLIGKFGENYDYFFEEKTDPNLSYTTNKFISSRNSDDLIKYAKELYDILEYYYSNVYSLAEEHIKRMAFAITHMYILGLIEDQKTVELISIIGDNADLDVMSHWNKYIVLQNDIPINVRALFFIDTNGNSIMRNNSYKHGRKVALTAEDADELCFKRELHKKKAFEETNGYDEVEIEIIPRMSDSEKEIYDTLDELIARVKELEAERKSKEHEESFKKNRKEEDDSLKEEVTVVDSNDGIEEVVIESTENSNNDIPVVEAEVVDNAREEVKETQKDDNTFDVIVPEGSNAVEVNDYSIEKMSETFDIFKKKYPGLEEFDNIVREAKFNARYYYKDFSDLIAVDIVKVYSSTDFDEKVINTVIDTVDIVGSFIIDPNTLYRNGYNLLVGGLSSGLYSMTPLSFSAHKNLIKKAVIEKLSDKDINKARKSLPEKCSDVLRRVDLTEVGKMTYHKWKKLVENIGSSLEVLPKGVRFRIIDIKSESEFKLFIDDKVKSPIVNSKLIRNSRQTKYAKSGLFVSYNAKEYSKKFGRKFVIGNVDKSALDFDPYKEHNESEEDLDK